MTKTFTCRELGGVCDEKFSSDTFMGIVSTAMSHMMSDEAHTQKIVHMETETNETKEQWMKRMQKEFDEKPEDN